MKNYEVRIRILNKHYIDNLIVALARQGYDVYYNENEEVVCFSLQKDELTEINYVKTDS